MTLPKIERILGAVGLSLMCAWSVIQLARSVSSKAAIAQFETQASSAETSRPAIDFQVWSATRIAEYESALITDKQPPLAILLIPKIGLEAPIFNGTDDLALNRGVGRIVGTAEVGQTGNIAIAGHRDGFFRGLRWLTRGDILKIVRPGNVDTYQVAGFRIVTPEDTSVLGQSEMSTLTLVTCYPFYFVGHAPKRYIVTAFLKTSRQSNPRYDKAGFHGQ